MGCFRNWLLDLGDDTDAWRAIAEEAVQRMSESECEDMAREVFDYEDDIEDSDPAGTEEYADLAPSVPTSAPVRFLRGLAHLIETNEQSQVRHAGPGTLLQRLYGSLNDDRDQTIVSLLGAGFETGDAEEACADMGLLDGE